MFSPFSRRPVEPYVKPRDMMSAVFKEYNDIELANICFRSRKSESNPTYNLYCIINALMINARYRCYGENALIDPPLPAPSLAEARRCRPITIEPCLDKVGKKAFKQTLTMQCAKILPPGHAGAGIGTLDYPACVCEIEMIIPLRPFLANDTAFVQPCKLHIRVHEGLEPLLEMLKNQIAQEGRIALFTITKAFEGYQSLPMIQ